MSGKAPPLVAVIGARKTRKTTQVKDWLKKTPPRRLLIWDPIGGVQFGYDAVGTVFDDRTKLIDYVGARPSFAVVFHPGKLSTYEEKFNWFCLLASELKNLTVVVDELADVTSPSWAPDAWREITRKGGNYGIASFGITQRPAEVDKTFLGNCSFIHCRRCNDEASIRTMAGYLRLPYADVAALTGYEFYERNMDTGQVRRVPAKPTYVRM